MHKKNLIYPLLLFILSIFIGAPFFEHQLIMTVDGGGALLKILCMSHFIGHDQWLVRWVPELYGYGYPLFNFYPPLFSLVGTLLAKLGLNLIDALNYSSFIFLVLSSFSMYLLAQELWGAEGGLLSAVCYIVSPYLLLDLYAGGSLAEAASFAFLPLILWSLLKLSQNPKKIYLISAVFSIACLFLTHNCTTLIFCPLIFLFILTLNLPFKNQQNNRLGISLTSLLLGIGLASFFWLPAFLEKKYVHTEKLLQGNLDFHHHFLSLTHLIYAAWPTTPGIIPFHVGLLHFLFGIITIIFMRRISHYQQCLDKIILFFAIILAFLVFLTLPISLIIWENIGLLKFIQFPWRLMVEINLALSALAGGIT